MKSDSKPHDPIPDAIIEAASNWLARRDRGLSAAEQDDYVQWLRADPRHAEALQQHAAALERMMQLYEWTPAHDTEPNPDLFAPPPARGRAWWRWASAGLAAAAAIVMLFVIVRPGGESNLVANAPKSYLRVNERLALPDGSRVELKDGSHLVVQYSENERRVKLTGGEAHFSVWKDKSRPFVVDAAGVEVRAVGTAFNVRLDAKDVQVLVTEGQVGVRGPRTEDGRRKTGDGARSTENGSAAQASSAPGSRLSELLVSVGEMAKVSLVSREQITPAITSVAPEEIARELAWQAPRLEFDETPLADAVAEFNRLNRDQIEIGDAELGALRIGGTFRPDNVEGFVRLLSTDPSFRVRAEAADENRTVLRRVR